MSNVLVNDEYLTEVGNAIRTQLGTTDKYLPSEMANAILSIEGGGGVTLPFLIETGTIKLDEDHWFYDADDNTLPNPYEFSHSLGKQPYLVFIEAPDYGDTTSKTRNSIVMNAYGVYGYYGSAEDELWQTYITRINGSTNNGAIYTTTNAKQYLTADAEKVSILADYAQTNMMLSSNITYNYVLIARK